MEGDRAATAVCGLVVCLVADEGDSCNYLGTEVLGGRPSSEKGYNCNLGAGTGGFLWCGPARLQCETWVFLAAGTKRMTCQWPCPPCCPASQCMFSCIALLFPEVRWSEMEWHVSLACFLGLALSPVCAL